MIDRRIRRHKADNELVKMNESFQQDIREHLSDVDTEHAICLIKHNDGSVSVITTDGEATSLIGTMEVGKMFIWEEKFKDLEGD